jgi:hypothetical protein
MVPHRFARTLAVSGAALALLLSAAGAQLLPPANVPGGPPSGAQAPRPGTGPNDSNTCLRLESALAQLDSVSNASPDTVRRYEEAINRQRFELDQTIVQSRRMGCDQGGGFFVFGASRPPACPQLDDQIRRMRANMDRMTSELGTMRGGTDMNRDLQRRQLVSQLAQNNCGAQYRSASQPPRQRGILESLFGGGWNEESTWSGGGMDLPGAGTFRTMCVRSCDGYFFPISYATVPARFGDDERTCRQLCPAAEATLYVHRNPGEEIDQAVSASSQQPYTAHPNAFKYRTAFNNSCSCRAPGQSWADALGVDRDQTLQQGDIVVDERRARQMAQPRPIGSAKGSQPKGAQTPASPTQQATEPAKEEAPLTPIPSGRVRVVGPQFYPVR